MTIIRNHLNIGGNANITQGLRTSTSEYTWLLADDDSYDFNDCEDVINALLSDKYDFIHVSSPLLPTNKKEGQEKDLTEIIEEINRRFQIEARRANMSEEKIKAMLAIKDGMVYIYGRMCDYSIINEEKVYNFDIEKVIIQNENVINCAVVNSKSEDGLDEQAVHIVLKNQLNRDVDEIICEIQDSLFNEYNNINYVPVKFKIRETIPTSKTSKRDNIKMKAETEGFVYYNNQRFVKKLIKK